jgi:hypothetical protein
MASEPPARERLPFEPAQKKSKAPKRPTPVNLPKPKTAREAANLRAIPAEVSQRIGKRMAIFCGIPTSLGMLSFFIFYWVVSHNWLKIPPYLVFATTLGLFGLGFLGLSYGIFSASWDEGRLGGWWGWEEFRVNFGRTVTAWRTGKAEAQSKRS